MTILHIRHQTRYEYRTPVQLGEHRLMTRPRDSHDLRLLDTALVIEPGASHVRWIHDVFGNSIAIVSFDASARQLTFTSDFHAEHFPSAAQEIAVEPYAANFPFSYSANDAEDLGRTKERHYPDPEHRIDQWARTVLQQVPRARTLDALAAMTTTVKQGFRYQARDAAGVQSPLQTLECRSGSCRDFALFMMEAARSLGLAARFVSGYLYDEQRIGAGSGLVGTGATHAWVQIYLPGAGWVEYDPTNGLVGGRNLIRVAVTRDPSQAVPLTGSFKGATDAYLSMSVGVEVTTD
ncbi:MAG TPA: transglutaminase family protein [Steroidobacteraceae bacterium]|jgi:transglutaminase-like putative cysteine protease|nr:transglutaminase family protein [Steroidobacteraceae bacterium]